MKTSKYQNTCEPADFPGFGTDDYVAQAAYAVMVEGQPIDAAAHLYGVSRRAVSVKCHRIAQRHKRARIGVHAGEMYYLITKADWTLNSQKWVDQAQAIINEVEES